MAEDFWYGSPPPLPGEPARAADLIVLTRRVDELEGVVKTLVKDYYTAGEPTEVFVGDFPPIQPNTLTVGTVTSNVYVPRNPADVQRIAELERALDERAAELEQTLAERDDAEVLIIDLESERDDLAQRLEEAESHLRDIRNSF